MPVFYEKPGEIITQIPMSPAETCCTKRGHVAPGQAPDTGIHDVHISIVMASFSPLEPLAYSDWIPAFVAYPQLFGDWADSDVIFVGHIITMTSVTHERSLSVAVAG